VHSDRLLSRCTNSSYTPTDLYTDPQLLSPSAKWGDIDTGIDGITRSLSCHICSPICHAVGATPFHLSQEESERVAWLLDDMKADDSTTRQRGVAHHDNWGKNQIGRSSSAHEVLLRCVVGRGRVSLLVTLVDTHSIYNNP
jgi:hypothetical protein